MWDSSAHRLDWLSSVRQFDQLHVGCFIISPGSAAFATHGSHRFTALPHGSGMCCVNAFGVPLQHTQPRVADQNRVTVNPPTWPKGRVCFITKQQKHKRVAVIATRDTVKITECDTLPSRQLAATTQRSVQAVGHRAHKHEHSVVGCYASKVKCMRLSWQQ